MLRELIRKPESGVGINKLQVNKRKKQKLLPSQTGHVEMGIIRIVELISINEDASHTRVWQYITYATNYL